MVNCGITGYKETINKFGLNITSNHKVYNKQKNIFTPIDSFTTSEELDIMSLRGLITWKKKLLNLMGKSTKDTQRADIILSTQLEMKTEKNVNNCTEQSGNIITEKLLKAIKYIIKTKILTITTLATWSVFQLGNIYQNMVKNIGKIKNTEKKENVLSVQENVELNTKEIIPVYNITVENAGCYYANGILVSNCDSLANLFTNVLNCAKVGKSRMKYTREELGI